MTKRTFLPLTHKEMTERGWDSVDIVFVTGDAYVDHPSFASALLGRLFESHGYRVGIVSQPRWDRVDDFLEFGTPRLCCMISSGNIDSMVSNYTANNKKRSDDPYSPNGEGQKRPDRALIVYTNRCREAFKKETPIIIGGIEASLRRFAHYDYWSDRVRRSILLDSKADLLVYGMGELQSLEILKRLSEGESLEHIAGTAINIPTASLHSYVGKQDVVSLPSFEEVSLRDKKSNTPTEEGKRAYALSVQLQSLYENPFDKTLLIQASGDRSIVIHPPMRPLSQKEFDSVCELPYLRKWHPSYDNRGGIPALSEVQFSITSNRGCFGSCTFCAITTVQGRIITNRSIASLVRETKEIVALDSFKGNIHDVGGPTANFQEIGCSQQEKRGACQKKLCLYPKACSELQDSHPSYIERLDAIRAVKGVKRVFIRSGIRYDYLLEVASPESQNQFMDRLARHHTSGQLRVAPEHIDSQALDAMGKPKVELYTQFVEKFQHASKKANKEQYCIPYLITSHPGTTLDAAIDLALYLHTNRFIPEQVQQFYPTCGTIATCMYYTSLDPRFGKNFAFVHVPKGRERTLQRALLHFHKKENRALVKEALIKANREHLIPLLLGR